MNEKEREIVIKEARMNALYEGYKQSAGSQENPETSRVSPTEHPVYSSDILEKFGFESSVYESSIDNLLRVRCIASYIEEKEIDIDGDSDSFVGGTRALLEERSSRSSFGYREVRRPLWGGLGEQYQVTFDHRYDAVSLTSLGLDFIETCTNQKQGDVPKE